MMAGTLVCSCSSDAILGLHSSSFSPLRRRMAGVSPLGSRGVNLYQTRIGFTLVSTDKCSMKSGKSNSDKVSSEADENVPSWASPNTDEPPPWAREDGKDKLLNQGFEIPFYGYLLASAITAIAAIGSAFEYVNQKPVFGLLNSDSIFYAPLLGFFAFTGIPTSAFLWFKSVQAANKEAEEQDRRDGYL